MTLETQKYYVTSLVEDFEDKALTIHGAWSHRALHRHGCGWAAIRAKGLPTYTAALGHIIHSNDERVLPHIAAKLFEVGDE